jgi:hypothetical protein
MVMMRVPTAGNHTRPLCMLTNFMTIYESTGCAPLSLENTGKKFIQSGLKKTVVLKVF